MDQQEAKEAGIIREVPGKPESNLPPQIFEAMAKVAKKLKAVEMKDMARYKARHIYDVYNMMQPVLAEAGIVLTRELISNTTKEVTSKQGSKGTHREQMWRFNFHAGDGSYISTTFPAESIDWGDKSSSQCDAMAFKQMLIHTFLIPTKDMGDPEDAAEPTTKKKPAEKDPGKTKVTQAQLTRLHAIMNQTGWTKEQVSKYAEAHYKIKSSKDLTVKQYNELVDTIMKTEPEDV